MPTIKRFEELTVWQLAREQCQAFFERVKGRRFRTDPPLCDQLNRSTASVADNIAEGFDRFSRAEFRQFLIIARGSAAEARSQWHRASDRGYVQPDEAVELLRKATNLSTRITNLISHLDRSGFKSKATGSPRSTGMVTDSDNGSDAAPGYALPPEHFFENHL